MPKTAQLARLRLVAPALLSALLIALAIALFVLSRQSGQEVTADNAPLYQSLALSLWSMLGFSAILSVWALTSREWGLLALAAILSGVFSVFALLSIGLFTLLLTLVQASSAVSMARGSRQKVDR